MNERRVGRFYPDFLRFQDDKSLQANFSFYCPVDFITRGIAFICYVLLFYALFLPDSSAPALGAFESCMLIFCNKKEAIRLLLLNGRDDTIRTCDPFVPSEVRYQAAPHPDFYKLN